MLVNGLGGENYNLAGHVTDTMPSARRHEVTYKHILYTVLCRSNHYGI